ncbi:hypothetical protein Dbac_1937 [Desulfomicrobium baculatum DSM 4028]|nr:hypothetical protein [Desulfomicrobium baculatum]ACU90026.1 hypothetical protein Dbac_1937 [Desulfomicrobium baculatum DSM 4028]
MSELEKFLDRMEPEQAAVSLALAARGLFALLNEEQRREFIERMLGEPGEDKVVGMVHL